MGHIGSTTTPNSGISGLLEAKNDVTFITAVIASIDQAAVVTTGATNSSPYGFTTAAQADAIVTLVNAMRAALVTKGIIKGAA